MARLTGSDLTTMVQEGLGGPPTELVPTALVLRWLNMEQAKWSTRYDIPQLMTSTTVTTSNGTAEYELTVTDVNRWENFVDTTNKLYLRMISHDDYHIWTQSGVPTGKPTHWHVSSHNTTTNADKVTFYPTPQGTYSIVGAYHKIPDAFAATTVSSFPESWDEVFLYGAIARGWAHLGQEDKTRSALAIRNDAIDYAWKTTRMVSSVSAPIVR